MKRGIKSCILVGAMLAVFNYTDVQAAAPKEANANTQEWEVLKIVNEERVKGDKEGLSTFKSLQSAAGIRAEELIELFSHTRPDGTSCFSILEEKNITRRSAGENIAAGYQNPQQVMNGWMNSPGHKSNIMSENSEFDHIGVGYVTGGSYGTNWVQLFIGGCTTQKIEVLGLSESGYTKETKIDDMSLYLEVTCDMHGTSYMPLDDSMCTGYKTGQTGSQTVHVSYHNVSTTFEVDIKSADATQPDENKTEENKTEENKSEENKSDNDTSVQVKKPAKVKSLRTKKLSASKVKLTWKKANADGYEIYMKTGSGKYKKVKTIKKAATTTYTVKKLKKNKKYSFKVRAYNKSGSEKKYGKYSAVKSIKL